MLIYIKKEELLKNQIELLLQIIFNPLLENGMFKEEYLNSEKGNLGIVIVDFVTKELAEAIYMRNVIWENY